MADFIYRFLAGFLSTLAITSVLSLLAVLVDGISLGLVVFRISLAASLVIGIVYGVFT